MSLTRPFLSALSLTTFALALSACGISTLGGGDGGGGSGNGGDGAGGEGGYSLICEGPDPSLARCDDDSDCAADEVCSPEACAPSGCGCDEEAGGWLCTADCNPGCVPASSSPCGADPSEGACDADSDCGAGEFCDHTECTSSSCSCDTSTMGWICTDDCRGKCSPVSSDCEGPNPGLGGCHTNADCEGGDECVMNGCQPSSCACNDGEWVCDADCAGTCTPSGCEGPNPQGCFANGCPDGLICGTSEDDCVPSSCSCTESGWACTDDCGGGICYPQE